MQIVSFVGAVIISGCVVCAAIAAGGPANAQTAPAKITAPPPPAATTVPRGRVYLFRGGLGLIFSRGMDKLAKRIEEAGVPVDVNEFTVCPLVAERAIREYRQDPAPITLIGHSLGGRCALEFAEKLRAENIPVSLIVTIDPAYLMPKLPMNVERYMNIFLARDVLGGGDVVPEKGFQGHFASFDLSKLKGVLHINIDKMDIIHTQLLTKILQIPETPASLEGEGVPIRYVVPPDAAVDLWDSGMPAVVKAGDKLETIAIKYRAPLWALTQINQIPEGAALVANQRVIVPRHLVPLAAVTGQSPSRR
ncbi:MAG TPA: thioesterase domain-containing protein [Pseudolabrys sp.]|nr:thioesterase domain-containing protein [Pseudolabrys sp.]